MEVNTASSSASLSTPPKPLSSREKFASAYSFSIPPPAPTFAYSSQQWSAQVSGHHTHSLPSSSFAVSSHPSPLDSSELLAKFSDKFTKRCEARIKTTSASSCARKQNLIASSARGKLLVPDIELKAHTGSSSSLSSTQSLTPLSSPATSTTGDTVSSFRPGRSTSSPPLATRFLSEEDERYSPSWTLRRPTIETRTWSYDGVTTYPIMQLPPKKITRIERRVVDGEECDVEVEVEVYEKKKCLFLFAPTTVCRF
ncbi:hypothetical protein CPB83DRAFT_900097 [Crepidotus variabilis]|uniref:Uncharacterized protein n=1 Tax=Crepidotus variabilis TaxID=179855 RepID=A0A9P6JI13_9AGAR|nr:hypothetical protein CPB83DRAFT_900097 [Crepidotus variabilis]